MEFKYSEHWLPKRRDHKGHVVWKEATLEDSDLTRTPTRTLTHRKTPRWCLEWADWNNSDWLAWGQEANYYNPH